MLAKFINENQIIKENKNDILYYDNVQVINPKNEDFVKAGYKEIKEDEIPEYNKETQYILVIYEEKSDVILKHYSIHEILLDE